MSLRSEGQDDRPVFGMIVDLSMTIPFITCITTEPDMLGVVRHNKHVLKALQVPQEALVEVGESVQRHQVQLVREDSTLVLVCSEPEPRIELGPEYVGAWRLP